MSLPRLFAFTLLGLITFSAPVHADEWKDASPHNSQFATVNGVKLHYLDWGGSGTPIIFLAGMGSSAHAFDDLAPRFTDRFRVLALTRRGHGKSDRPDSGYALEQLTEDIRGFMDSLAIKKAHLAGHSLGGDEITVFAGKYPDRVDRIVYLDGAFNRSREFAEAQRKKLESGPKDPLLNRMGTFAPGPSALASIEALKVWYTGNGWRWKGALEANIRECWLADGKLNPGAAVPPKAGQEIMQSAQSNPPDFSKVKAPVLNLVAVRKQHPALKPDDSEENKKRAVEFWQAMTEFRRAYADHVKKAIPSLKTVEIDGDHGQFFHEREDDVVREMRAFLLEP